MSTKIKTKNMSKKLLFPKVLFLLLLFLASSCNAQNSSSSGKSVVLNQEEFKSQISGKKVQLIDVRSPEEFNDGHISNSKNINYNSAEFKEEVSKLDKSKPVYVYCQAGGRSAAAAKVLVQMGFSKVYDLKGGYGSWKN